MNIKYNSQTTTLGLYKEKPNTQTTKEPPTEQNVI